MADASALYDTLHTIAEQTDKDMSGEETTIPIPRSNAGVEKLLDRLEEDREKVGQTDIEDLEAELDDAVYDLFDLTEDEREVVEDYLEVF